MLGRHVEECEIRPTKLQKKWRKRTKIRIEKEGEEKRRGKRT
jgi:hypothetical protein